MSTDEEGKNKYTGGVRARTGVLVSFLSVNSGQVCAGVVITRIVTMLIIVVVLTLASFGTAQPQISADGETLTLTGQTIAFEVDGGRTTVETLLNKGYDKATMDEIINELRSDVKTIVDANSDKVTKLESALASTKAELDTAKQERDEMAGKLRLLQAHADSDCRADQVGFFI